MPPATKPNPGELLDSWGRRNRKHAQRHCAECGAEFRPRDAESRYCSRPCMWKNNGGRNRKAEVWWTNTKGYVEGRVWRDGKPHRVKRHRLMVEEHIGRALLPHEDVHHKDGDKQNNDISNLEILTHGEHSRRTNGERVYKRGYKLKRSKREERDV